MSAPGVDYAAHYAQLQVLADAALAAVSLGQTWEYGTVPGTRDNTTRQGSEVGRPDDYTLIDVQRDQVPIQYRPAASRSLWAVSLVCVSTIAANANLALTHVTAAVEGRRLVIAGIESTPLAYDTGHGARPDGDLYSSSATWTYAL